MQGKEGHAQQYILSFHFPFTFLLISSHEFLTTIWSRPLDTQIYAINLNTKRILLCTFSLFLFICNSLSFVL